jgi:hypothetical protein
MHQPSAAGGGRQGVRWARARAAVSQSSRVMGVHGGKEAIGRLRARAGAGPGEVRTGMADFRPFRAVSFCYSSEAIGQRAILERHAPPSVP